MAVAELELRTQRVDSSLAPQWGNQDVEQPLPGPEFATGNGRLARIRDREYLSTLSPPQMYRLSVSGLYSASLNLPLQQDTSKATQVYLQTPENVEGLKFTFAAEINEDRTVN